MRGFINAFIIIGVGGYIIFLLMYSFKLDTICNSYSYSSNSSKNMQLELYKLAKCKDVFVCSTTNEIRNSNTNNLESWQCNKKKINVFEFDFYKGNLIELLK